MYEDFYPYLPGSLDARLRRRKRWFKRLCYTFGACIVFGSGFLLGLAWYEPVSAPTQVALQDQHPLEATNTSLDKPLTPSAERAAPSLGTDTNATFAKTPASTLSSVMLDLDTDAPPYLKENQALVERYAGTVSRPASPKPEKQTSTPPSYLVQVGAFRNATNARDIVAKLRHKGYQPFIRTVQDGQDRVLHRVFLDHAKEKTHAQATAKAFEETEKMEAVVMLATHLLQPDHRAAESR
jgi:cell division septation protein DedD